MDALIKTRLVTAHFSVEIITFINLFVFDGFTAKAAVKRMNVLRVKRYE